MRTQKLLLVDASLLENAEFENQPFFKAQTIPLCICCDRRISETILSVPVWSGSIRESPRALQLTEILYHINDFVYFLRDLKPNESSREYRVGKLLALDVFDREAALKMLNYNDTPKAKIQWLFRHNSFTDTTAFKDDRRLVISKLESWIPIDKIEGTFFMEHKKTIVNEYKKTYPELSGDKLEAVALEEHARSSVDAFWVSDAFVGTESSVAPDGMRIGLEEPEKALSHRKKLEPIEKGHLERCETCHTLRKRNDSERSKLHESIPFVTHEVADFYAGCGGLLFGLHESAFYQKTSPFAIASATFPHSMLYNARAGVTLQPVVQTSSYVLEMSRAGKYASLPTVRRLQFIGAGFPCQGFSFANMAKKSVEPKCDEPWVFMSLLEHFRPSYALCENVRAIADFALPGDVTSPKNGGKGGLIALMTEVALDLGYQVRTILLNAGAFGVVPLSPSPR